MMRSAVLAIKKLLVKASAAALPTVALAMTYPPYEVYTGTTSGSPQLTYTKICEPGRTGEGNASYVILGSYYPSRPALSDAYDGDVAIPPYIGGLPVRKINEAAFIACTKLRSVKVPATVREVGARAFSDCWLLTNVTFEAGIAAVGESAFLNCASLAAMTFPKTLSRLGAGCFQGCASLTDVYFLGDAPRLTLPSVTDKSGLGEMIFRNYGYYERFKVHIRKGTYGWIAPYVKGVPEKWPADYGYMQAHETVAEDDGGTVAEETGFVTVVTEIAGGPVAIPETWAAGFPDYAKKFGSDFTASLTKPMGKKDTAGHDRRSGRTMWRGLTPRT